MTDSKPRILIVDDETVIRDLLSDNLGESGYSCETAENGDVALQKLGSGKYDLVLLDIRLPGISGIDLLKIIKPKYETGVIMITAMDDVNTAVLSMKLGALDYLVKPFNLDALNSSIESALQRSKAPAGNQPSDTTRQISNEEKALNEIDAIAEGIQVKLNLAAKRSINITKKTIEIARELGIPEEYVKKWENIRANKEKKNLQTIEKFNKNAIAQVIFGVTEEHKPDGSKYKSDN